jgi:hypothetical protein
MNKNKLIFTIFLSFWFNSLFSQVNVDSLVKSQPLIKIDKINRARVLLWEEVSSQNKNIEFIASLQNYLNKFTDGTYVALDDEEKFLLFAYTQQWDSVLSAILKMKHPYQIHEFHFEGEDFFFSPELGSTRVCIIKKSEIIDNMPFAKLAKSDFSEEEKDFIKLFVPKYLGYKRKQYKSKHKDFVVKYPTSKYLKYINNEE